MSWSEEMGLALIDRNLSSMKLRAPTGEVLSYTILQLFPFTSESKRMGIIVQASVIPVEFQTQSFRNQYCLCIAYISTAASGRKFVDTKLEVMFSCRFTL